MTKLVFKNDIHYLLLGHAWVTDYIRSKQGCFNTKFITYYKLVLVKHYRCCMEHVMCETSLSVSLLFNGG